jgi:hypothetical protein
VTPKDSAGRIEDGGERTHDGQEVVVANKLLTISLESGNSKT